MDKKKSIINVFSGVFFKLVVLIVTLFSRKYLINVIGNAANGVISLFTSIIGILSVAELGVGTAISFCMYKPIIDKDEKTVASLYNLFRKIYLLIGSVILIIGLLLTPAIPFFAKNYQLESNIYILFIIQLVSVVVTYFYSAQVSLINAYKNNYVTTTLTSLSLILKSVLQIVVLIVFKSFYLYIGVALVSELIQIIFLHFYTKKKYSSIISLKNEKINSDLKVEVTKNIKAIFFHKIGALLVNTIDSVVISTILGVVILGYYSNYITIINSLIAIITLFFSQLVSIIGHAYYTKDHALFKKYFKIFYLFNYFLGSFSFLCFFAGVEPFINLFFAEGLLLEREVAIVITINYFIQFMEQAVRLFKDSTGLYYYDRYKCIFEGLLNLTLSIAFVYIMGVTGVIIATIITNIFICHIVEPYVLYKHIFNEKPYKYYLINYILIGIFCGIVFLFNYTYKLAFDSYYVQFIVGVCIAICFSLPSFALFIIYFLKQYKISHFIKEIRSNKA